MGSDNLFQKKKFRKEKEFARAKAKKAPYETILIVCEDSHCSPNYFRELIKHFRLNTANIIIVHSKGSAPISVAEQAIETARTTASIDRVACVLDRDTHESFNRATNKLQNHKPKRSDKSQPIFQAITSTPCFEIWPLLHFCYTTKAYSAHGNKSAADHLISDLEKRLPSFSKSSSHWFHDIIDKIDIAVKYAKQLQEHNDKTSSTNPSTDMHDLIEYLMNIKSFNPR